MALFKKGKKGPGGKATKKGKRAGQQYNVHGEMEPGAGGQMYEQMITPRNEQML